MPAALFDRIPAGFFGPLGGSHASLYWALLGRFYELEYEGEPQFLVRPVAVQVAEDLLRASPLWSERREELAQLSADATEDDSLQDIGLDQEAALARATARRLVARLEEAGWFYFEYRSEVGPVLSFHPYAARILEALVRVARDEQPVFQGYAHSIATLLRKDNFAVKPGIALREARRNAGDLVRELKILDRNIFAFTKRLIAEAFTAADVLEHGVDRYRQAVMGNYHRLKTVDNLYKWLGEILQRLDEIDADEFTTQRAAQWYAEQLGVEREDGQRAVDADLQLLRRQFDSLPELIADIDDRNSRFSGVALRRLMYLLRHDKRVEGLLQLIVDALAEGDGADIEVDVYRCELLGTDFLYTPPRRRPKAEVRPIDRRQPANVDELRKRIAPKLRRPHTRAKLEELVERLLAGRSQIQFAELPVGTDDEYVRAIYAAAFGLEKGTAYEFTPDPQGERTHHGPYGTPSGMLRRKRRR